MRTIASQLEAAFRSAITSAFGVEADPLIGVSQTDKFGDYQSNAAMGLAKVLAERTGQKTNPRQVAEQIKAKLELGEMAQEVTIAGPGFLNVRLDPAWLARQLAQIGPDARLGIERKADPQTVVVDYSGPNIAKQMHVGHLRSTIIGDAVARTLDFWGDRVIRQNHLGDWGTQFGRVVLAMWYEAMFHVTENRPKLDEFMIRQQQASRQKDAAAIAAVVNELAPFHQQFIDLDETGTEHFEPYLKDTTLNLEELERAYQFVSAITDAPEAALTVVNHPRHGRTSLADVPRLTTTFIQNSGVPLNRQEGLAWRKAVDITLESCNQIYWHLDVELANASVQDEEIVRGESFYQPFLREVVEDLGQAGIATPSEGAIVIAVPGYETPLIIEKKPTPDASGHLQPGGFLYGTTDLAAIRYRTTRLGAKRIVYFVDARQGQHFTQVFWTAKQAGWADGVALEHAAFGTMLGPDNKPFKTRSGDTVKLKDLIGEARERAIGVVSEKSPHLPEAQRDAIGHAVGVGAVKYADLSKDRLSDYVFAWERMLSFDGNTAPYLQNAFVRVHGIFRKAKANGIDARIDHGAIRLDTPVELALAKHMLRLGEALEVVARELKPHHLCNYLYELANRYHQFFEHCPVLQSDEATRASRLALCDLTARTLGLGLDLLGIGHPEQM